MDNKTKISVAMCTYNGQKYLRDQLDSLCSQSRRPDEVVISDDGSSDGTLKIAEDFMKVLPIRLLKNDRSLGLAENFQQAIANCSHEIIFTSDQDDVWLPEKLSKMATVLENDPSATAVFCDAHLVDSKLEHLGRTLWDNNGFTAHERRLIRAGNSFPVFLRHNVAAGTALAFRKSLAKFYLPISPRWIHDYWIVIVLSCIGNVKMVEEPLLLYRQHEQQTFGATKNLSAVDRAQAAARADRSDLVAVIHQFQDLIKRLEASSAGGFSARLMELNKKIAFFERRNAFAEAKLSRIIPIIRSLAAGEYQRYTAGLSSAAKDLLRR